MVTRTQYKLSTSATLSPSLQHAKWKTVSRDDSSAFLLQSEIDDQGLTIFQQLSYPMSAKAVKTKISTQLDIVSWMTRDRKIQAPYFYIVRQNIH
jgi:hypothetical protein